MGNRRTSTGDAFTYGWQCCKLRFYFMTIFDDAVSLDSLYEAFQKAKQGSDWKASVQQFEMHLLPNLLQLRKDLLSGEYRQGSVVRFTLRERGKTRRIQSISIRDRVAQRALCDKVLLPAVLPKLIYDNGASVKDKGISFTRSRLQCHLERFIRRHGVNGYVLCIGFSKFFDNIPHDEVIKAFAELLDDPRALELSEHLIRSYAVNLAHLSNEEADAIEHGIFNSVGFRFNEHPKPGDRLAAKSLGIGSQISQVVGLYYLTPIDNLCKTVMGCKYYGRYMEDIYVIHEDKAFLHRLLDRIKEKSKELKLFLNERKTQIRPLRSGFSFMQIRYSFTENGKVIKRLAPQKIARERRKLKAYRRLLDEGKLSRKEISNAYQSWKGNLRQFNCHQSLKNTDALYNELFCEDMK